MNWNVMPFRGIRYNTDKPGGIDKLIAPPYDVISPEQRDEFCAKDPCNIVRLTLGADKEDDSERDNRYTRAGEAFSRWEKDGALEEDPRPAIYVYDQEYALGDRSLRRRAFFAAVRLEPFGGRILPHEETMPGPKADRLRLLNACPVNLSPIFGLYADPERSVSSILDTDHRRPEFSFVDYAGIKQTLWKVEDPNVHQQLSRAMQDERIYIADGHHRYETALEYRDRAAEAEGGLDPADPRNYVMIACVALSDPGLVVMPAHRVIGGMPDFDFDRLLDRLSDKFDIVSVGPGGGAVAEELLERMNGRLHTFGLYAGGKARMLTLKDDATTQANPAPRSRAWKQLDVSVLVWLILEQGLGCTHEDLSHPERVKYVKDAARAARLVDGGAYQVACYLNSTRLDQLEEVARGGERMPPKSTYFYPKLLTGLVMRKLR
ncbi:MAG: DUF1015 domain-containing protein [Planctomycetes bacterium]|nr:DUF1015 domain-containing protein [Planctomycetota bacterium]